MAFSVLMLSFGLAMDATAVAMARGFAAKTLRVRDVLKVAFFFGGFQAAMPLVGLLVGHGLGRFAASWDHWIAFALLSAIGSKMVWAGFFGEHRDDSRQSELFGTRALLVLAVATSVDALAAGITLPMLNAPPGLTIAAIGLVTAATSAVGLLAGHRFGAYFGPRLDVLGGAILVVLGVKILVEHLRWTV